jgi:hypothetical protein
MDSDCFVTTEFPTEIHGAQNRNYPYTETLATIISAQHFISSRGAIFFLSFKKDKTEKTNSRKS